jgi:hypothetical protein
MPGTVAVSLVGTVVAAGTVVAGGITPEGAAASPAGMAMGTEPTE